MKIYHPVSLLLLCLINLGFGDDSDRKEPRLENGILELHDWNFFSGGVINLDGEWEFYWQKFLQPIQFIGPNPPSPTGFVKVPLSWNTFSYQGEPIGGKGYGTYHLKIISNTFPSVLTFDINSISTSYIMYINGNEVSRAGHISKDKKGVVPEYRPNIISYAPQKGILDIVIQVANFHHADGGMFDRITMGSEKKIRFNHNSSAALHLFIAGSLIIIGLYHLAMYPLNDITKSPFYLGILSIILGIRALITGDITVYYFIPSIPWEILIRVEYFTLTLGIPVFVLYQYDLFKEHFNKQALYTIFGISGLYSFAILFTPAYFFTGLLEYYLQFTVIFVVYTFVVNILAIKHKSEYALGFLFAYIILMITFINDALYAMEYISTGYFSPVGILAFIAIQAVAMSVKFTGAFKTIELQNIALNRHRETLETTVQERTAELEKANIVLKKMTVIDALTQIPNRRRFDEYYEAEWSRLKRDKKPMSLILCDIDFFKKYNDHYGHQQGDDCLEKVAQALKKSVHRPADLVARYGGEEFCAVLPNTPMVGAEKIAAEMLANVQKLEIPHAESDVSKFVSISIGVGQSIPGEGLSPAELIELTDKGLYTAKSKGRNCVICLSHTP